MAGKRAAVAASQSIVGRQVWAVHAGFGAPAKFECCAQQAQRWRKINAGQTKSASESTSQAEFFNTIGSLGTFAALVMEDWSGKHRPSLHHV